MKPTEFLKLIGAPWSDTGVSFVRDTKNETAVASLYGAHGNCAQDDTSRARARFLTFCPDLYRYVASMATTGDTEAKLILRAIHGSSDDQ